MAGTKAGGQKTKDTIIRKFGEDYYRNIGAKGGSNGHTGGFYANRAKASYWGRIGGRISRRTG